MFFWHCHTSALAAVLLVEARAIWFENRLNVVLGSQVVSCSSLAATSATVNEGHEKLGESPYLHCPFVLHES